MQSNIVTEFVLPFVLSFIMLGMGMTLVLDDFKRVTIYPKAFAVGILGQLIILPLIGWIVAKVFPLSPEMAVGIIILSCSPGGATSNLITHLAKGDIALSITLTAFSSTITVFSLPILVNFSLQHFVGEAREIQLPLEKTILSLFLITILPTSIGMFIRSRYEGFAKKSEKFFQNASTVFMTIIVVGLMVKERAMLLGAFASAGPAALTLNVVSMLVAFLFARFLTLNDKQTTCVSIEVGIQNSTLSMLVAGTFLNNPTMAIPPAIYSLVMYMTAAVIIYYRRKSE